MSDEVSEVTRRQILDHLSTSHLHWAGRLNEAEFLSRLFDLSALPSSDYRLRDAASDIGRHRVNWTDWNDDWVFYDSRFNVLHGDDTTFLSFLSETIHPVVRPREEEVAMLLETYNELLAVDGWELFESGEISGRPLYSARRIGQHVRVFPEPTGWVKVDRQMQEARMRLDTATNEEQYQAVGLICREALISLAQEVFDADSHELIDDIVPSTIDAGRMLQAVFGSELSGSANEEARAHAKAALKLALALQHKRTADFRIAALCAEATSSVVNLAAVLANRRRTLE